VVFRVAFPEYGKSFRVVFSGGPEQGAATRLLLEVMSLQKRPGVRNPRRWVNGRLARRRSPSVAASTVAWQRVGDYRGGQLEQGPLIAGGGHGRRRR
jgi:hypothetical protein